MDTLFSLIFNACVLKDNDSTWALIYRFKPLLIKYSIDPKTNRLDEDLLSELHIILYNRIQNFRIF